MHIRPETPSDIKALHELTYAAFEPMSFSDNSEADLLDNLRSDGDLYLSLVAIDHDRIIGHIAFSPAVIGYEELGWFGIGPVSVAPDRQRSGVGSALMAEGLNRLRVEGAKGCALTGNPDYYSRFGFVSDGNVTYSGTPNKFVQWLAFKDDKPTGELRFSKALQE